MWEKLKRVPLGLWAALGVALTLLGLYLRGRRLDAELARANLQKVAAKAHAATARNLGKADVHLEQAREAQTRIEIIRAAQQLASMSGKQEERRLVALPPDRVHEEYLKLLEKKRQQHTSSRPTPVAADEDENTKKLKSTP